MLLIDNLYKYEVDETLEGGMGRVLLLTQISAPAKALYLEILNNKSEFQDMFKVPFRSKLAAKTVKDSYLMRDFERECIIWLGLNEPGVVPLLKVVKIDGITYALMPRYQKSLRSLLQSKEINRLELIKLFYNPILGLANIHSLKGIVHQDIKPENLLYDGDKTRLLLSDWGIANMQANMLSKISLESTRFTFQTMAGFGTIPYMAPERFLRYYSSITADIFSLGIVFIEILTGNWPYNLTESIDNQILNGNYFHTAKSMLSEFSNKISNVILSMIHPAAEKRMKNYKDILKFIKTV